MRLRTLPILLLLLTLIGCGYDAAVSSAPPPTLVLPPLTALPTLPPQPTPTTRPPITAGPTVIYPPDAGMYAAAIDAFFSDRQIQALLQPDLLKQKVAYIRPTFWDTGAPMPAAVLASLEAHASALGLTRVLQEESGGASIGVSLVKSDPENTMLVYGKDGPTISLIFSIVDDPCGGFISIGYLLTKTDAGWTANQYQMSEC